MLASIQLATRVGAPAERCRTTTRSTPIAAMVCTVSRRLSPLRTDEVAALKLITSHESRLAAVSKEIRVRVESS
jgi:hypothetical protein